MQLEVAKPLFGVLWEALSFVVSKMMIFSGDFKKTKEIFYLNQSFLRCFTQADIFFMSKIVDFQW